MVRLDQMTRGPFTFSVHLTNHSYNRGDVHSCSSSSSSYNIRDTTKNDVL